MKKTIFLPLIGSFILNYSSALWGADKLDQWCQQNNFSYRIQTVMAHKTKDLSDFCKGQRFLPAKLSSILKNISHFAMPERSFEINSFEDLLAFTKQDSRWNFLYDQNKKLSAKELALKICSTYRAIKKSPTFKTIEKPLLPPKKQESVPLLTTKETEKIQEKEKEPTIIQEGKNSQTPQTPIAIEEHRDPTDQVIDIITNWDTKTDKEKERLNELAKDPSLLPETILFDDPLNKMSILTAYLVHPESLDGLKTLLDRKDIQKAIDDLSMPLMAYAFSFNNTAGLKELLDRKLADVNYKGDQDMTMLMSALVQGNEKMVELLLEYPEIDLNQQNKEGISALDFAEYYSSPSKDKIKNMTKAK